MTTINSATRFQLLMQLHPLLPQPTDPAGALALLAIADGQTIRPGTDDTIARIDAVLGCHWCGEDLGESPAEDFCGESCQQAWRADQVGADLPARGSGDYWLAAYREAYSARLMQQRRAGSSDGEQHLPVAVIADEVQFLRDTHSSTSRTTASEIMERVARAARTPGVVVDQSTRENLRFRPSFGQLSGSAAEMMRGADEHAVTFRGAAAGLDGSPMDIQAWSTLTHWDIGPITTGSGKTRQILPALDSEEPVAQRDDTQPDE